MSPRKLTDADKEELLVAYRETSETTSTLAERYGVSSSTISRFLKSRLTGEEYEDLIQQKRLGRSNSVKKAEKTEQSTTPPAPDKPKPKLVKQKPLIKGETAVTPETAVEAKPETKAEEVRESPLPQEETSAATKRRSRSRRSRVHSPAVEAQLPLLPELEPEQPEILEVISEDEEPEEIFAESFAESMYEYDDEDPEDVDVEINPDLLALAQEISLGDRQQAMRELLGDDIDEDEDDDDEFDDEDDDEDEDDEDEELDSQPIRQNITEEVKIRPLTEARFPRTCYIVTDRMLELIARPMKEFRDLGKIPDEETSQPTLPIFDNHRVAKRFTRGRSQKVIKIPDSSLFIKTSCCLTSKGITRILLGGQIYKTEREHSEV